MSRRGRAAERLEPPEPDSGHDILRKIENVCMRRRVNEANKGGGRSSSVGRLTKFDFPKRCKASESAAGRRTIRAGHVHIDTRKSNLVFPARSGRGKRTVAGLLWLRGGRSFRSLNCAIHTVGKWVEIKR